MRTVLGIPRAVVTAFALVATTAAFAADGGTWSVSKSSGEVWMGSGDVQQVSLKSDDVLKPGDTIRTGRNGRVLLVRGEESILIAPNSVVGLPAEAKEGLSTTIIQKAGSILLEVEKKNVKHFEVETPYLAAVVKGTKFEVKVSAQGTSVGVIHGQVEVSDFKSGQIAQVMPGQHATVFSHGNAGLSLGGSGILQPIEQGKPRASTVDRVPVPKGGLTAPGKPTSASLTPQKHGVSGPQPGVTRISGALGEVKLNVHKATHGLARNAHAAQASRSADRNNSTVWGPGDSGTSGNNSNGNGNSNNNGNGNGGNNGAVSGALNSAGNSVASTVAAVVGSGTGNGNNGNGNGGGNGNGNNGNGNGNGGGNGSNAGGNGNGNGGGNGQGNAFGKSK
jgi:hypothetical protein